MASTSVKGVGTLLPAFAAGQGMVNTGIQTETESFQSIWNRQTGQTKQQQEGTKPEKQETVAKTGKSSETTDNTGASDRMKKAEKTQKGADSSGKEVSENGNAVNEEAMAVLQTAAAQLINQVADTFGISVEQVQEMMQDLQLEPLDLLQADKLGALILQAGGAQDTMSLLTNEALYQDYQSLMDARAELMSDAAQQLGSDAGQLETALQSYDLVPEEVQKEPEGPVVEVIVEKAPAAEEDISNPKETKEVSKEEEIVPEDKAQNRKQTQETDAGKTDNSAADAANQVRSRQGAAERHKEGHSHGNGHQHTGNLVLQQMREDMMTSQVQQTAQGSFAGNLDTADVMNQIMDYMKVRIRPDSSNLEMQLHPESLGTLQVQVASKGGVLTAQFITQNEAVKAVLESQMIQLKESFEQQGVKVEAIEVNVQTQQFDRNLDQGRSGQPEEQQERRNRTRRIRLDADAGIPDAADFDEEERLAADIMAANGNTVDYTA